jgi:hypothetical protein
MNYAWMCPIVLEKALNNDPTLVGTFSPSGDSMIYVDRHGKRVTNEKLAYNESAQAFFEWDPTTADYPHLVLIAIWDGRSQAHSAGDEYGRFIVPEGTDDAHVIMGQTLADDRALQRVRPRRQGSRLPPRRAHRRAIIQRAGRGQPDGAQSHHVPDRERRAFLCRPDDRRQSRYQRWTGDERRWASAQPYGPTDPRPLWRRQLRRIGIGASLLGRRRDLGTVSRLRLPRRQFGASPTAPLNLNLTDDERSKAPWH